MRPPHTEDGQRWDGVACDVSPAPVEGWLVADISLRFSTQNSLIFAHHRSPPFACSLDRLPVACPGRHTTIQQPCLALPLAWRSGCLLSRLSQSSKPAKARPESPARPSSAKQRYRPGAPLSPSPEPHANYSSPSKSIPYQNRRFPLFALLQSSSPAIPTLPHPSHSL
ncbi:hypothetical protein FJTKL_01158 [Diaporthe vaccinii]|uniref:Uncharacterized protein n=1 Tax=Diaporthe vaccinii TaxID=105482 RepID=A0ABR4F5T0_9PEZI